MEGLSSERSRSVFPSRPKYGTLGPMATLGKCKKCGKTTYSLEGYTIGPPTNKDVYHKGCFKCQNPGCNWQLTLTSYKYYEGKIYCKNHNPMTGFSSPDHAHGTMDTGAVSVDKAISAPRAHDVVNEQVRGARSTCKTCGTHAAGLFCSNCGTRL